MVTDLQDWYAWVETILSRISTLDHGGIAGRPAVPGEGDCYLATDTGRFYVCYVGGNWTDVTLAYLLLAGGAMTGEIAMGANKITGLADPAAAQDAATRAYVLDRVGLYLPLTGGTLTGDLNIGAHKLKTTNLFLEEFDIATLQIRNAADDAYRDLRLGILYPSILDFGLVAAGILQTGNIDNRYVVIKARDAGVGLVEIARLQGAADPYFAMGGSEEFKFLHSGAMGTDLIMGGFKVTGLGAPVAANDAVRKAYADLFTLLTTFNDHSARHEAGGDDVLNVAGLSGVLADPQTPIGHHTLHELGNADEIVNPLNAGALPALNTGQIWQGVGNRPSEVAIPVPKTIATGSYTGDDTDNRQITTGFKCSLVIIQSPDSVRRFIVIPNITVLDYNAGHGMVTTTALLHAADGFVVDQTPANLSGLTYYYWAISE